MNSRLTYFFVFISLFLLSLSLVKPSSFINELIVKSDAKRNASLKENIFIHTDRNNFFLSDTIWFKGYVSDYATGKSSNISQTVYLDIIDQGNKIILSQEFYNDRGMLDGAIPLPENLSDGEYNLVAYTSMMKNHSEQWYFNKPIYIKDLKVVRDIIPNLNLKMTYDKKLYKSGDDVVAELSFIKEKDDGLNKTLIEYTVKSNKGIIKSFESEAINSGNITIRFTIPENAGEISIDSKVKNRDLSLSHSSIVPLKSKDLVVAFFPEGGEIISNLKNKIAFQATDSLGNGVDISGQLVDGKGNKVTLVTSEHNGLGTFTFVPLANNSYSLFIEDHQIALPQIVDSGIILSVENKTEDKLSIRINSSFGTPKKVYVTATMRDKIYWSIEGQIEGTAMVEIPLTEIPKGILQLTLFDNQQQPLIERLCYVNQHKNLKIDIVPSMTSSSSRDSISLKISVKNYLNEPVKADLSLAAKDVIFDTHQQNEYYSNIENYLPFSSQLHVNWKKEINNLPIWNKEKMHRVIELMMLTYGWRKFEWDKLDEVDTLINYELIEGRVTKGKKKIYNSSIPVHLMAFNTGEMMIMDTDKRGYFSFDKKSLSKASTALGITSFKDKNSTGLRISIIPDENPQLPKFVSTVSGQINYSSDLNLNGKNSEILDFAHSQLLQEIVIREKKDTFKDDPNIKDFRGGNVSSKKGDELLPSLDIVGLIRQVTPITRHDNVNKKVFFRAGVNSSGALFIVNGFIMGDTYANIATLSPNNIEYLSVVKGLSASVRYGSEANGGVVFITTKFTHEISEPETSKSTAFLKGYSKHKVFYSPKYKTEEEKNDPVPDLRKTIYWDPNIITDENGEAIVGYYNADRRTTINVAIQGMSNKGLYGSANSSYRVTLKDR